MKTKTYGFTTTPNDAFVRRIAKEAKPKDQFLVASTKNVMTGDQHLTILVREAAIPDSSGFILADNPLTERWGRRLSTGFRYRTVKVPDVDKATNIALNEIQRIKNFVTGRIVRVLVQSV